MRNAALEEVGLTGTQYAHPIANRDFQLAADDQPSFFAGVATSFARWTVVVSTAGLVAACVILPIPIVLGYGVRAAAREDRQHPR